jgi:hypothetical protein
MKAFVGNSFCTYKRRVYTLLPVFCLEVLKSIPGRNTMAKEALVAEREWARALARRVANHLPEAIRQVRGVQLTPYTQSRRQMR